MRRIAEELEALADEMDRGRTAVRRELALPADIPGDVHAHMRAVERSLQLALRALAKFYGELMKRGSAGVMSIQDELGTVHDGTCRLLQQVYFSPPIPDPTDEIVQWARANLGLDVKVVVGEDQRANVMRGEPRPILVTVRASFPLAER